MGEVVIYSRWKFCSVQDRGVGTDPGDEFGGGGVEEGEGGGVQDGCSSRGEGCKRSVESGEDKVEIWIVVDDSVTGNTEAGAIEAGDVECGSVIGGFLKWLT